MSMTYNSLVNQLTAYLDRSDTSTINQIPNFISQAEQRICREAKNVGLEQYVSSAFTPTVPVYQKPARWRQNITLNCSTTVGGNVRNQLMIRSYEFIRINYPDDTVTGLPLYYSDYGYNNFLVAPTPDVAYSFELAYLELPEPISVTTQTNWLTNYAPDVLLYASLLESVSYLKDDERVPVWQQYYDRALASLTNQDTQRITDRASKRDSD
jgi:hypothetical protein